MFSFFDLLGGFRDALGVLTGERLAAFLVLIVILFAVAFWWNLKTKLPVVKTDWDETKRERERLDYLKWRDGLALGGQIAQTYNRLLESALGWLSRILKDDDRQPQYWSAPALDRCLLLALIYPIITLIAVWHLTGQTGPVENALQLQPDTSDVQRGLSAISIVALMSAFIWVAKPLSIHQAKRWRTIRLLANVATVAVVVAGAIVGAVSVAVVGAFAIAIAIAIAVSVASARVVAAAGAMAIAMAIAIAIGVASGVAGAMAIAMVVVVSVSVAVADELIDNARWALIAFTGVYFSLIVGFIRFWDSIPGNDQAPEWTLLIFLGVLPLLNALFDWVSIGFTRWLLNAGLSKGEWWGLLFALADLIVAALALFALMIVTIGFLEWLNVLSAAGGGNPVLDIRSLIETLKTDPSNPSVWWIYVTIFTTFIPSLVNLTLGGLSVIRGLPGVTPWVSRQLLPVDMGSMTEFQRYTAAAWLSLQMVIAIGAALFIGLAVMFYFFDFMSLIGLGLISVADTVYTSIEGLGR